MHTCAISGRWPALTSSGLVLILLAAALSGCNLSGTSGDATQAAGDYASAQQSLSESGSQPGSSSGSSAPTPAKCPSPGIIDFYNLCFSHQLNFVMSDGNGFTLTPYKGSNCVLLSVSSSEVKVVGSSDGTHSKVGFKVDGDWDFAGATCTLEGQTLLSVSVYGSGNPPCRDTDHLFLLVYESWEDAPVHAECKPKDASGDFHSNPVDVTIPVLGERGVDLEFWPVTTVIRQEGSAGAFSGLFIYSVEPAPGIPPSEVEPIPLVDGQP